MDILPNGAIRLRGHRIGLEYVVGLYRDGLTAEEIAAAFSEMSLEQVHAAIAYYLRNHAAIDASIAAGDAEAARMMRDYDARSAAPVVRRLRALKAQRRHEQPAYSLEDAPLDDEPTTPEEDAASAEAWAEYKRGEALSAEDAKRLLLS